MKCSILTIAILALLSLGKSRAQSIYWQQTNGPEGGLIPAVSIDSMGNVLAGTAAGGVYRSTDNAASWMPINNGLGAAHIKLLESSENGYVFALTYTNGMYRYQVSDAQFLWNHLDSLKYGSEIVQMAIDPKGVIYLIEPSHGIVRSTNDGTSWLDSPPPFQDSTLAAMAQDQIGRMLVVSLYGSLYRTNDHGASWEMLGKIPNELRAGTMTVSGSTIFVADDYSNIYRSSDGGETWHLNFVEPKGWPWYSLVTSVNDGHVYARNRIGSLYRYAASGDTNTWVLIDTTLSDGDFFPMVGKYGGQLFLGSDFYGMFHSNDAGNTWSISNHGLLAYQITGVATNSKADIFALTERLVFRSMDGGDTWSRLKVDLGDNFMNSPIAIDQQDNVFIGNERGILRSSDNGTTWNVVDSAGQGDPTNLVGAIAVSHSDIVLAASQHGLSKSIDHGITWTNVSGDPGSNFADGVVIGPHDEVIASLNTGMLYRSVNDGASWKQLNYGDGIRSLDSNGRMYRVSSGLWRSDDTGMTWTQLYPTMAAQPPDSTSTIYDVHVTADRLLLAATHRGIFRSTDGGNTWLDISTGLVQPNFHDVLGATAIAEDHNGVCYAGSLGGGVYKSIRSLGVSSQVTAKDASPQIEVFPNPTSSHLKILFTSQLDAVVSLDLIDELGRTYPLMQEHSESTGDKSITCDLAKFPAGAYWCRLRIGASAAITGLLIAK
jgi:photosystem II stability/assembly factor-like uncharacterized protein